MAEWEGLCGTCASTAARVEKTKSPMLHKCDNPAQCKHVDDTCMVPKTVVRRAFQRAFGLALAGEPEPHSKEVRWQDIVDKPSIILGIESSPQISQSMVQGQGGSLYADMQSSKQEITGLANNVRALCSQQTEDFVRAQSIAQREGKSLGQMCNCDGPSHPYDPKWCTSGSTYCYCRPGTMDVHVFRAAGCSATSPVPRS